MKTLRHIEISVVNQCCFFLQKCQGASAGTSSEPELKKVSSLKNNLSPKTDVEGAGETSSTSWVIDSSGFLSPTGPVLKEVLDMVDGVSNTKSV